MTDISESEPAESGPNAAQAEYWGGERGEAWVRRGDQFDAQLSSYAEHLLLAAVPRLGEHVLDIGCGAGVTTLAAANAVGPTGSVVGLDISAPMLGLAAERAAAAGVTNAEFVCADAQTSSLPVGAPTLVMSRFGVMFFDDPEAAFRNIAAMCAPDARLAFACWAPLEFNQWMWGPSVAVSSIIELPQPGEPNAPGPFAFSDAERVAALLAAAGWSDVAWNDVTDEIHVGGPGTVDDTIDFVITSSNMAGPFQALDAEARQGVRELLRAEFEPHFDGVGVRYPARARIMTAQLRPS